MSRPSSEPAPLRWVRSDAPGLRRERSAGRFRYRHPDGSLVRGRSVLALDQMLAQALQDLTPDQPAIVRHVASRPGNTRAVCRSAYLHPAVLALATELAEPERRALLRRQPWFQGPRHRGSA